MWRRAAVAGALFGGVLAGAAAVLFAQGPQAPPVFRDGVDVVQLDVTVLDENRQPVRGLTAADFTVLERGVPQPVVSFGAVDLPPRPVDLAPWVVDVAPDVATNRRDAQRVVVILLDDCGIAFDPDHARRARLIATTVVDLLGPADLASVVYTAARPSGQEFTTDRARLREAVDRFTPQGRSPTPHPFSASRTASGRLPLGFTGGSCLAYRPQLQAMQNAAGILSRYPGWRKTLVYVSPFTLNFGADSIETSQDFSDWALVLRDMQRANMTVYQFDPRGLEVGVDLPNDLGAFSDATGGRTYKHTNAPEEGVPQMFRENGSYYMLGIQPLDLVRNGRFRPVEVRVDRPGVTVRTRSGYFAPRDERPARPSNRPQPTAAERAIAGALPSGDLVMSLAATARPGTSSRGHVIDVLAGFEPLGLSPDGEDVDVLVTVYRDDWREAARATQTARVTPRGANETPRADIPVAMTLPAGRYEVRAAVTRPRTGETGSAYTSLTVPDFGREPLSLSGVVIERSVMAEPTEAVAAVVVQPTTVRDFPAAAHVVASLSVQQGGRQAPVAASVELTIIDEQGRTRARQHVSLGAPDFGPNRSAGLRFDLPFAGLEAGEYLASFEATSPRGRAARHVRLTVR